MACAVRVVLRALTLLLHEGRAASQVATNVPLTSKAVRKIGRRYPEEGLDRALYDRPRPGAVPLWTAAQRKPIVAMVCSDPPQGLARWTVRWIAEEAVQRKLVPGVGRETIRILLAHDDLPPWREKMWCIAELDQEYLEERERAGSIGEAAIQRGARRVCGREAGDAS
jgi:hypothetical protein